MGNMCRRIAEQRADQQISRSEDVVLLGALSKWLLHVRVQGTVFVTQAVE
jgi:hypothetical protein